MEGEKKVINQALWLECAGPLITLPAIGSQVVYFPQGHSEQVIASTQKEVDAEIPSYPNLPPQLFCLLHNVTLHADQENDEVFAQMTLQPFQQTTLLKDPFLLPDLGIQPKQSIVSFSKTLTASDTSTHGGFSIPRRAAEKVFPPLDFTKTPPAQELVARDLHNNEWHFRHIYRGQPRRHLLTTGWSVFVSAKRLQAGDTVLFIRDEQGQLMLGIRRANRQQANLPTSLLSSDSMLIGVLAAAAHAAATNSRFTIFYNPRASPSEFVIPLAKYQKALHPPQVTVGMRFRMEMETEDSSTRRYMGTITGIGDLDPVRWPNSHWRSLKVGWDESTAGQRQRRVSAWEIEPLTAPFLLCNSSFLLRSKRLRPNEEEMDMKVPSVWPRGEEGKYSLQGINFGVLGMDHWLRLQQQQQQQQKSAQSGYYSSILQEMKNVDTSKPYQPMPFNQMPPPGMLQPPQQLLSMPDTSNISPSYLTPDVMNRNSNSLNTGVLSRQNAENILGEDTVSSYTSMLTSQQTQLQKQLNSGLEKPTPAYGGQMEVNGGQLAMENTNTGVVSLAVDQENDPRSHVLFGFNIENPIMPYATPVFKGKEQQAYSGSQQQDIPLLNEDPWPQQVYPPPVRTFTKVHKVGSVGRSLDMTRFKNYNELRNELTRMFGLELDQKSGWQIVFIDNENDMLLLGDDPWEEFIGCVKSIRILSSSEILQMSQEHMEWLNSIPVQHKQASSSSEDPRRTQQQECDAIPLAPSVPRSFNSYSDPSCISDGI